jgi:co-chaperonin GroES (HSP10)
MKLQGTTVLVKPERPTKTSTGIILPLSQQKSPIGRVMDSGPGCETVKAGDRVHYSPKRASLITIEGEEQHFVSEGSIAYIY